LIQVDRLRKVFPNGHEALNDVSFRVERGEFVCIIGRSGAGKSTLLRCIDGAATVTSGSVRVNDTDMTTASRAERRRLRHRIGFVFQEFNLVERLPVLTNVLIGRLGHAGSLASSARLFNRDDRELALHNLERVHLMHRAQQRADSLSGGEKQRVAIARAMTQEPFLLLADEPVASLDPELARGVMNDLKRLTVEQGVPALVNIHDVELAKLFSDRLIGIAQGRIVFDGPPAQLTAEDLFTIYRSNDLRAVS